MLSGQQQGVQWLKLYTNDQKVRVQIPGLPENQWGLLCTTLNAWFKLYFAWSHFNSNQPKMDFPKASHERWSLNGRMSITVNSLSFSHSPSFSLKNTLDKSGIPKSNLSQNLCNCFIVFHRNDIARTIIELNWPNYHNSMLYELNFYANL